MTVGAGLRRLTRVIRRLEREGWTIASLTPESRDGLLRGNEIRATLTCHRKPLSTSEGANGQSTSSLSTIETGSGRTEVEIVEVVPSPNGGNTATLRIVVSLEREAKDPREAGDADAVDHPPLHRHEERLRSLYHEHASFAEIAESVDEEVSAETIRRYMIEHDIHEPGGPGPRDTSAPETASTPPVLADGHGLPHGLDLESLMSAVERSNTLYDIQRQLDIGRREATELLARFDLLDLVVGRVDTADDRRVDRETIEERLRRGHH